MAGAVKTLGVTPKEAVYGISYANLILYSSALPSYENEAKNKEGKRIDATDPQKEKEANALIDKINSL